MAELVKQNSKTTTSRPWPSDPLISASPTLKFLNANGFPKFESKPDITFNYQVTNGLSIVQSFEDISQQEEGCLTGGKSNRRYCAGQIAIQGKTFLPVLFKLTE